MFPQTKNTIKNPNIIVGDYTYYFDTTGTDNFEDHVTNFYSFSKDKLIIGKFCDIATGIEFVMGAANHRMNCVGSMSRSAERNTYYTTAICMACSKFVFNLIVQK